MPIAITLRSTKGSQLTSAEVDANFSNIKAFTEALVSQISAKLNDDGTLKDGAADRTAVMADGIVTVAKLATDATLAKKVIRYDASGVPTAAVFPQVASATDSDAVNSTGAQTSKLISTIIFSNVPAGDIAVNATAWAQRNAGSNGGTLTMMNGSTAVCSAPTHSVDITSAQWVPLPMHGVISAFAGGTLTLTFVYETSETTSDIVFGVTGDGRFGRKVTLIAGF